ncbi:ribokinase [Brevibacterium daeguense]|uniref:Ribokinase n=1 Tax=Brevibacterium daeguense TaxID=909936 RepID=A0ABP8EFP4_9MICO
MDTNISRTSARDAQSPVFEFPDIVVVGSINADLVTRVPKHPEPGETVIATGSLYAGGGKGANQAVAASLLGARVSFVGAVGRDARADVALVGLREAGVDISRVTVVEGETGLAVVAVDATGENEIIVIPGANARVTPADVAAAKERVEYTPIVLTQGELSVEVIDQVARLTEGRFVFNAAPALDVSEETLAKADPLVVNEREARVLASRLLGSDMSHKSAHALTGYLAPDYVRSVVITEGARGCTFKVGDEDPSTLGQDYRVIEENVVDTTGAGDMFVAALCVALGRSSEMGEACDFANSAAAQTVVHAGAQSSYFLAKRVNEASGTSTGREAEHPA